MCVCIVENKAEQWLNYAEESSPELKTALWQGGLHLYFRSLFCCGAQGKGAWKKTALGKRIGKVKEGLEKALLQFQQQQPQPQEEQEQQQQQQQQQQSGRGERGGEEHFLDGCLKGVVMIEGDGSSGEDIAQKVSAWKGGALYECVTGSTGIFCGKGGLLFFFPSKVDFNGFAQCSAFLTSSHILHNDKMPFLDARTYNDILCRLSVTYPAYAPLPFSLSESRLIIDIHDCNSIHVITDAIRYLDNIAKNEYTKIIRLRELNADYINSIRYLYSNSMEPVMVEFVCSCKQKSFMMLQVERATESVELKTRITENRKLAEALMTVSMASTTFCTKYFIISQAVSDISRLSHDQQKNSQEHSAVVERMCIPVYNILTQALSTQEVNWYLGPSICMLIADLVNAIAESDNWARWLLEDLFINPQKVSYIGPAFRPWEKTNDFPALGMRFIAYYSSIAPQARLSLKPLFKSLSIENVHTYHLHFPLFTYHFSRKLFIVGKAKAKQRTRGFA